MNFHIFIHTLAHTHIYIYKHTQATEHPSCKITIVHGGKWLCNVSEKFHKNCISSFDGLPGTVEVLCDDRVDAEEALSFANGRPLSVGTLTCTCDHTPHTHTHTQARAYTHARTRVRVLTNARTRAHTRARTCACRHTHKHCARTHTGTMARTPLLKMPCNIMFLEGDAHMRASFYVSCLF